MGAGSSGTGRQAVGPWRRTLRADSKPRPRQQRAGDAPAPTEKTLESALRITENETQYQSVAHQDWRGQERARACLRIDRFKVTQSGSLGKEKAENGKAARETARH